MEEKETVRVTVDMPRELHRAVRLWAIEATPAAGAVVKLSEITRVLYDRLLWDRELAPWVATEIQRRAVQRGHTVAAGTAGVPARPGKDGGG